MKRTAIHTIRFVALCDSGLHIGGSQDELTIGGADNPVIKNPETRRPYIPGSSLKGKMRAELEKETGRVGGRREDEPCGCGNCLVCRVFGAHKNSASRLGPSRIIVRDGQLHKGGHIENKTENVINRQTGAAQHPRTNERVVEGTEFRMQIVLQVFESRRAVLAHGPKRQRPSRRRGAPGGSRRRFASGADDRPRGRDEPRLGRGAV